MLTSSMAYLAALLLPPGNRAPLIQSSRVWYSARVLLEPDAAGMGLLGRVILGLGLLGRFPGRLAQEQALGRPGQVDDPQGGDR